MREHCRFCYLYDVFSVCVTCHCCGACVQELARQGEATGAGLHDGVDGNLDYGLDDVLSKADLDGRCVAVLQLS